MANFGNNFVNKLYVLNKKNLIQVQINPNYKYSSKQFSSEITMNKSPREHRGYSIEMPPMEGDLPLNY